MAASRRFMAAVALSLAAHALILSIPLRKRMHEASLASMPSAPLNVLILPAESAAQPQPAAPVTEPEPTPEPRPLIKPPEAPRPRESPRPVMPLPPPRPVPEPQATPKFDMMAAINARRERRRAESAGVAPPAAPAPTADDATLATINRNLRIAPTEGVGGVFTILRKGTRTAEFSFNGWRPESYRQWREVIEVDAGTGGDIDRAIVRRMIQLIRTHYTGDFRWESHKLGRTVVLSARPEDNDGLEDFLIREFFDTPTLNTRR